MSDVQQAIQRLESEESAQSSLGRTLEIISNAAKDPTVDIQKLERLMALHERMVARRAEELFNGAMREVQSSVRYVQKDAKNASTNSSYTRLETLNAAIVPVATEHGFSLSFGTADCPLADTIRITCSVQHTAGHTKMYQADVPIDVLGMKGNPSKTRTHGYGSALSYGRRYLTLMIFNLSTGEDDDGNAAGRKTEGPEVLIGLKTMLWTLLKGKVGVTTWDQARQWLTDELLIADDMTMPDLHANAQAMRDVIAKATKKLEARA